MSMAIAQLEAELDLQLFDRSSREPAPTAIARALEPQARLLAEQLQLLNWQAQALHEGLEERLTLVIAPELLATHWSEPLTRLVQEFPALPIEVLAAPQADALELLHSAAPTWHWHLSARPWTAAKAFRKWAAKRWSQ
ncbi:LysR family transcriptional regulator [Staphylococcus epidermidis]|nr:LysR family transcriptional regulator [Staphylococcus epidermidis]